MCISTRYSSIVTPHKLPEAHLFFRKKHTVVRTVIELETPSSVQISHALKCPDAKLRAKDHDRTIKTVETENVVDWATHAP